MAWLELKIPPLLLVFLTIGLILVSAGWLPTEALSSWRWLCLLAATLVGGIIALLGVLAFKRAKTTVLPHCPEKSRILVTTGIYRYTRNPMYLGLVIFLLGLTGFLGRLWGLLWVVAFVLYITHFQIKPEERQLAKKFTGAFDDYQRRVRRWL